jgi:hypothetical protein
MTVCWPPEYASNIFDYWDNYADSVIKPTNNALLNTITLRSKFQLGGDWKEEAENG